MITRFEAKHDGISDSDLIGGSMIGNDVIGSGVAGFSNGRGPFVAFNRPSGLCTNARGNIYVADTDNHAIRVINNRGEVSTIAGTGVSGYNDGSAHVATFNRPQAVYVDDLDNVYVADTGNNSIRLISRSGYVTTVAGALDSGDIDGPGTIARFNQPVSLTLDHQGGLLVADWGNCKIRRIILNSPLFSSDNTHRL